MNATPKIYVACLSSYNAGTLHGEWVDAIDADEIREGIADMLADSPDPNAEEYAVHDYDDFGGIDDGEYPNIDELAEVGRLIEEHGDAYAAYADYSGWGSAAESDFQDAYNGEWDSEEAFGEHIFDELYLHEVPAHSANYIDYAAFARDLFCGDYYTIDDPSGGVFVFRNN